MPDINETHGVHTPSAYIIPKYILLTPDLKVKSHSIKIDKFIQLTSLTYSKRHGKMNAERNMRAWWNWGAMGAPPVAGRATWASGRGRPSTQSFGTRRGSGTATGRLCKQLNICGCGGIGRLGGFRFLCLRRAGSSPVIRTINRRSYDTIHSFIFLILGCFWYIICDYWHWKSQMLYYKRDQAWFPRTV